VHLVAYSLHVNDGNGSRVFTEEEAREVGDHGRGR
jgi:hypothetical protein